MLLCDPITLGKLAADDHVQVGFCQRQHQQMPQTKAHFQDAVATIPYSCLVGKGTMGCKDQYSGSDGGWVGTTNGIHSLLAKLSMNSGCSQPVASGNFISPACVSSR